MEISDVPINTGFGLILARGVGDLALAGALSSYAAREFEACWQDDRFYYQGAPRTLHATALYALASAIAPGGADFTTLFTAPPDRTTLAEPAVLEVAPTSSLGVSQAEYDRQTRTLAITLRSVGDPTALRAASPVDATVTVGKVAGRAHIEVSGRPLSSDEYAHQSDRLTFGVTIDPAEEVRCLVRLEG
jgi:hypothetical protein